METCRNVVFTESLLCPERGAVSPPSGSSRAVFSRGAVCAVCNEDHHTALVTNESRPGEIQVHKYTPTDKHAQILCLIIPVTHHTPGADPPCPL